MKIPRVVQLLGYAGLLPFFMAPIWATWVGEVPAWLDQAWLAYVVLLAAFLSGTFWGFALPAAQGPAGLAAMLIATALLMLTWVAMLLPLFMSLLVLLLVFLLLLLADFWRERVLDSIPGYFELRSMLTGGVLISVGWRALQLG